MANIQVSQSLDHDVHLLKEMVNVDSQTNNVSGVNHIQKMIAKSLNQIGFKNNFIENKEYATGDLLISNRNGNSNYNVTLVAHGDTVSGPCEKYSFSGSTTQDYLFGPGIADNKAGILIALRGLRNFLEHKKYPKFNIQLIISPSEELGSQGFHQAFKKIGRASDIVLGFEPALNEGSIITSRKGNRWYKISVYGQSGHSGRVGKNALNAAHELSLIISQLHQLNNLFSDVSVNVGSIKTNHDKFNIICGEATAKVDVRFSTKKSRDIIHQMIIDILNSPTIVKKNTGERCRTLFSIEDDCPPFERCNKTNNFSNYYNNLIKNIEGISHKREQSGGAADINYLADSNTIAFDGLGPIAGNIHRKDEYIKTTSLDSRSKALTQFLIHLDEEFFSNQITT